MNHRIALWMAGVAALSAVLLALGVPIAAEAFESPNSPSSGELVERPQKYDGERVTFQGEVVGEAMIRGDNAWVHLNDDAYMYKNVEEGAALDGYNSGMPVWIDARLAKGIEYFGDYKHEGDVVSVTGVYNAACAQHGGDMDIHATSLERVLPGRPADDPIQPWKVMLASAMAAIAAGVWWAEGRASRRERAGGSSRR